MISIQTFLLIAFLAAGIISAMAFIFSSQFKKLKESMESDESTVLMEWLKDMKASVEKNTDTLERQLKDQQQSLGAELKGQREAMAQQTKVIWERLENASKVIGDVQQHLGGLQEFGKDMKDLSNILKSPKLRGNLGERFLYEILENFLPKNLYKTQYKFKDGAVCDAVIVTDNGFIPVDAKFPMENFEGMLKAESDADRERCNREFLKDVKKRIDEISGKYILPEEGTTDQAIMYIPSESVYYEAVVRTSGVEEYAHRKGVLITSPNTFTSFVNIVMIGYQQNELAEHATEILKALAGIKVEAEKFGEDLSVLERHITNSYKNMDNVTTKYQKLLGKIDGVQALSGTEQNPLLE